MVTTRSKVIYLLFLIMFLASLLAFVMDWVGFIRLADYLPILKKEEKLLGEESEPEDLLEKLKLKKQEKSVQLGAEKLARWEMELKAREAALNKMAEEINDARKELGTQKAKFKSSQSGFLEREKKIGDMALKINNMPPEDAIKILGAWPDMDVIAVLRQMDRMAEAAGEESSVPYLITLMDKAEAGRGGAITKKMLMDPKTGINTPGLDLEE